MQENKLTGEADAETDARTSKEMATRFVEYPCVRIGEHASTAGGASSRSYTIKRYKLASTASKRHQRDRNTIWNVIEIHAGVSNEHNRVTAGCDNRNAISRHLCVPGAAKLIPRKPILLPLSRDSKIVSVKFNATMRET